MTAKKTTRKKAAPPKTASKKSAAKKSAPKKSTAKTSAAKKSAATNSTPTAPKKASQRKAPSPPAPAIDAPIVVDAGNWRADRGPLGAHVSIAGGTWEAAARAREISATAAQIFTKQANRWVERDVTNDEAERFRDAMRATTVRWMCSHDSYLINLASPDDALRAKSLDSFRTELRRCHALGLDALVSHPGNFMDDRAAGIERNAEAITAALDAEPGPTLLLMELTAGQGTVLGSTFGEMAALLAAIPARLQSRLGVCLDTAHVWAAGYDLIHDFDGVWQQFDDTIGITRLGCLHLNDSKAALGSHLDRHELIGEGTIGADAFRRIMQDTRLHAVPKIIETPKGDAPAETDGRMLKRLRDLAAA
jgi:deoxyribonuclease-4